MGDHPGAFGAVRKHDIHSGVDLYVPAHGPKTVVACEDGVVVSVEAFTGPKAGTPWWNNTDALLIEGNSGVICYGEIEPMYRVGDKVKAGSKIGSIVPVIPSDKIRPDVKNHSNFMLHLELYEKGTKDSCVWDLHTPKPKNLQDPTSYLIGAWVTATQLL